MAIIAVSDMEKKPEMIRHRIRAKKRGVREGSSTAKVDDIDQLNDRSGRGGCQTGKVLLARVFCG
jgi:hypothetical protein